MTRQWLQMSCSTFSLWFFYLFVAVTVFIVPTHATGHMEKQEMEMKRKLEMETGNGNWKRKPETENRNGNATSLLL